MVKKLKFSKINFVERTGALMLVDFLDEDGNMYNWAPKWSEVEQVFLKQINVERFNKPESAWLNRFARTAQNVVEGAQKIESGYKVYGCIRQCQESKLVIDTLDGKAQTLTPVFDITIDFLDKWLQSHVEAFIINGLTIRLREYIRDEDGSESVREYPPFEPIEPKDIPF